MKKNKRGEGEILIVVIVTSIIALIIVLMFGIPTYKVWTAEKSGEALKMKATQERQIIVEQARAEVDSAKLRAEAIKIVGEATQKYPEYRIQEFIGAFGEALNNGAIEKIIYVPTEANIPILEVK